MNQELRALELQKIFYDDAGDATIGGYNFYSPDALPLDLPYEFGLRFPSARAVQVVRNLIEGLESIGIFSPNYEELEALANLAGPYLLDDGIARGLRSKGISLDPGNGSPYTAAQSLLTRERYQLFQGKTWSAEEIRDYLELNNFHFFALAFDKERETTIDILLHAGGVRLTCWKALDALDLLEFHRRNFIEICVRRITAIH